MFKRVKKGRYISENGLTVVFKKIGSNLYADLKQTKTKKMIYRFTSTPLTCGIKEFLVKLEPLNKYNFKLPELIFFSTYDPAPLMNYLSNLRKEVTQ